MFEYNFYNKTESDILVSQHYIMKTELQLDTVPAHVNRVTTLKRVVTCKENHRFSHLHMPMHPLVDSAR